MENIKRTEDGWACQPKYLCSARYDENLMGARVNTKIKFAGSFTLYKALIYREQKESKKNRKYHLHRPNDYK